MIMREPTTAKIIETTDEKSVFSRNSEGVLFWCGHNLNLLSKDCGTPSLIYDEQRINDNVLWYREIVNNMQYPGIIAAAIKATGHISIIKALQKMDTFCEVMTEEEFQLALKAGYSSTKIIVNGLGWSDEFLKLICTYQPFMVNVDNVEDGYKLNEMAKKENVIIQISLRLIPQIDQQFATSTEKLGTIVDENVFDEIDKLRKMNNLSFVGFSVHALHRCSDITDITNVVKSIGNISNEATIKGIDVKFINIGGGLDSHSRLVNTNVSPLNIARLLNEQSKNFPNDTTIIFEPGRFLVSDAAIILTQVRIRKRRKLNDWLIVDSGTNVLIPLPTAKFEVYEVVSKGSALTLFDVADGICSPSSTIAHECSLSEDIEQGDILAISNVGAYALALGENWGYEFPSLTLLCECGKTVVALSRNEARINFYRAWGAF